MVGIQEEIILHNLFIFRPALQYIVVGRVFLLNNPNIRAQYYKVGLKFGILLTY